jgi:hypothetical protein
MKFLISFFMKDKENDQAFLTTDINDCIHGYGCIDIVTC